MNIVGHFLLKLFLIVIFLVSIHVTRAQESDVRNDFLKEPATQTSLSLKSPRSDEIANEERGREAILDRSIGILNIVATLMGVLVGLVALIIAIAGYLGFYEFRTWKKIIKEAENDAKKIRKSYEEVEPIVENIKKVEEEKENLGSKIQPRPLTEEPTAELRRDLEEFAKKIEFLEAFGFGAKLTAEDYFKRAADFYYNEKYELALKALDEAIKIKPDFAEAWSNKGVVLDKLGRTDDALKALDEAIKIKPDLAEAWYNKGNALAKLGRTDDALKAYDEAIKIKPDYAEAWSNKGFVLAMLGRRDDALKAYDEAIKIKPDLAGAWYNKACAYSLIGVKKEALENLSKAISLDSKLKAKAREDEDFKNLREDDDFKKLVGLQ
ncbi:MAG: hypothetical protein Kow0090_21350 [Myxococcota bacterium]